MKKIAILAAVLLAAVLAAVGVANADPTPSADPSPSPSAGPALTVTRVNYNAVGADTLGNRWQEAIYIRNTSGGELDIARWAVHDAYKNAEGKWGNSYTFPAGTKVAKNGLVVVSPAAGVNKTDPNATQVYYMDFKRGYHGHFLNNSGDTVYVDDADGKRVDSFVYDFDNGYYVR